MSLGYSPLSSAPLGGLPTEGAPAALFAATLAGDTTVTAALRAYSSFAAALASAATLTAALSTAITMRSSMSAVTTLTAALRAQDHFATVLVAGTTVTADLTLGSTANTGEPIPFQPMPHITETNFNQVGWQRFLKSVNTKLTAAGQIGWDSLSFAGSNLTDLETRRHNDLQQIQGGAAGDFYHVTGSTYADLTSVVTKTANYTVTLNDGTILCNASGGSFTITVLAAKPTNVGKTLNIKKIDNTNKAVNITCTSQIDGVTTWTITDPQTSMQLKSDGTTWRII